MDSPLCVHSGASIPTRQAGLWGGLSWGNGTGRVLEALKENPALAEDPKALLLAVWEAEGLAQVLGERLEAFRGWFLAHATTPELITRERRRLIEEGLVRLSPKAEALRRVRERAWRERARR